MNRFTTLFSDPTRRVFIPYFTLGYPTPAASLALIKSVIDQGAEALELGIPFSDPVADGPTNQRAMAEALQAGMTFDKALAMIAELRAYAPTLPIGLLLYYNLIFHRGLDRVYAELAQAGVDAVVCPELPLEESAAHEAQLLRQQLGCVQMVFPNTPLSRAAEAFERSSAFTYVVARLGPTGASSALADTVEARIAELRTVSDKPMVLGFGLSTPEQVRTVWRAGANGAIVASRFAQWIAEDAQVAKARILSFVQELSQ